MSETKEAGTRGRKDFYEQVMDVEELPPMARGGGGPRGSQLEKLVNSVSEDASYKPGGWRMIGHWSNSGAAGSASTLLKKRYGYGPEVGGYKFATRQVDVQNGDGENVKRTALYVSYDPSAVVEGAKAKHDREMAKREKQAEARKQEKSAAKASA